MKLKIIKNPAASVRARLLAHAKQHGDNHQRILTRYAIERLLFRLSQTKAVECYVLKGAMLFVTWPEHVFRPTGDLDLLGQGNPAPAAIAELFTRICQVVVPNDSIRFDPASLKIKAVREADFHDCDRNLLLVRRSLGTERLWYTRCETESLAFWLAVEKASCEGGALFDVLKQGLMRAPGLR
jgi:hypothetical protein